MTRPGTQLLHTVVQPGAGTDSDPRRLITLHDHDQHGTDVAAWGVAANPDGEVLALESYKGVFVGKRIVGYTWFVGPPDRPSPIFFGDALAEIERFLLDHAERPARRTRPQPDGQPDEPGGDALQPPLPFLLGVGQGAIMALAAAAAAPDLLSGVIAIGATFPVVPGWQPPLAPLDGLPILLVPPAPPLPDRDDVLSGATLAETFTRWGGTVTTLPTADPVGTTPATPATTGPALAGWLRRQPARRFSAEPADPAPVPDHDPAD